MGKNNAVEGGKGWMAPNLRVKTKFKKHAGKKKIVPITFYNFKQSFKQKQNAFGVGIFY